MKCSIVDYNIYDQFYSHIHLPELASVSKILQENLITGDKHFTGRMPFLMPNQHYQILIASYQIL